MTIIWQRTVIWSQIFIFFLYFFMFFWFKSRLFLFLHNKNNILIKNKFNKTCLSDFATNTTKYETYLSYSEIYVVFLVIIHRNYCNFMKLLWHFQPDWMNYIILMLKIRAFCSLLLQCPCFLSSSSTGVSECPRLPPYNHFLPNVS